MEEQRMLRLVDDLKARDPRTPPVWADPLGDDYHDHRSRSAPRRESRSPGSERPSVALRVALTVATAAALACAGVAAFSVAQSRWWITAIPASAPSSRAPQASTNQAPPALAAVSQPMPQRSLPAQPAPSVAPPIVPGVDELVVLIRNALVALDQANAAGNYAVVREIAAPGFQQANSPAGLSQAFADLRARDLDLGQIAAVNPRLTSGPAIDQRGFLHLVGFFPAEGTQINFNLVFQLVGGNWRLFGIGVYPPVAADPATAPKPPPAGPAAAPTLPADTALIALIRGAALALNQANLTGDYSVLRDISAPGFQAANSLAKLGQIFADLRARRIDLAPVAVIDPRLFRPAAIDKQGYLRLSGYFPSKPEQVNFDLAFQLVAGQWQLFGIGLNTSREEPVAAADPPAPPDAAKTDIKAPPAPRPRPKR